uniref:Peptidase aspartic, catalytic n=1 Tax=Medicago truncatula TaxID=3880 RepID=Q2HUN0_MEDTR|nr:Peptidase aspartic, catalytic [Medicago truncatula]
MGSLTDKDYDYNQLILGEEAYLAGDTTPFQVYNGVNHVTMEGISIGQKSLDIAPGTFKMKNNGTGGGLSLTQEVRNLFQRLKFQEVRLQGSPWALCYFGSVSRDLKGFPVVTFYFAGGAVIGLDTLNFFVQAKDDVFCMSVHPSHDLSVIGLLAQQSYNVGYDKDKGLIYIESIDCQLLSS